MNNDEILQKALDEAVSQGADEAEAYLLTYKEVDINIQFSKIHDIKSIEESGISIRAYKNGALGFAYATEVNPDVATKMAQKASALAKAGTEDKYFKGLPSKAEYPQVEGTFSTELASLTSDKLVSYAVDIIKGAKSVDKDAVVEGGVKAVLFSEALLKNTKGVNFQLKSNSIHIDAFSKIQKTKNNIGSGFDFWFGRRLDEIGQRENIGVVATKKAKRQLNSKKTRTRTTTLLLSPIATWMFVEFLGKCLDGLRVSYNLTCLTGMLEQKVASELFTIYDDPLVAWGMGSCPADAEGTPRKRFAIIENGMLRTYLHNSYTAGKMGHQNTASATRSGFRSPVSVGLSNPQVKPGEGSFSDLLSKIEDGIFIDSFPWGGDVLTGTISSMIDFGIEIKKAKLCDPVKSTMMGGNFVEFLKNIKMVSREAMQFSGVIYPYLVIEGVKVASQ